MTFKRTTLEETLAVSPLLVLDGAMSTPLENMGIDLNTKLWTAKVLADQPEMVKQVHKNYFKAGADCGITCSYQATVPGLMDIGYTKEQAEEMVKHIFDKDTFDSDYGLTTLAKDEKMFDLSVTNNPSNWLGPIWGVANYVVFRGLLNYGFRKEAELMYKRTITLL